MYWHKRTEKKHETRSVSALHRCVVPPAWLLPASMICSVNVHTSLCMCKEKTYREPEGGFLQHACPCLWYLSQHLRACTCLRAHSWVGSQGPGMYRKVNFDREDVFALPLLVLLILLHASEEEFLCMPKSAKTRAHSVPLDSKIGRNHTLGT